MLCRCLGTGLAANIAIMPPSRTDAEQYIKNKSQQLAAVTVKVGAQGQAISFPDRYIHASIIAHHVGALFLSACLHGVFGSYCGHTSTRDSSRHHSEFELLDLHWHGTGRNRTHAMARYSLRSTTSRGASFHATSGPGGDKQSAARRSSR